MNASKYDHVVEVKKHVKVPWYKRCLDFSLEAVSYTHLTLPTKA